MEKFDSTIEKHNEKLTYAIVRNRVPMGSNFLILQLKTQYYLSYCYKTVYAL